jgi:hypothetical protein
MRKEYDFSRGVRGKYAGRVSADVKVILLEADVAKVFPDSQSVNDALRVLAEAARRQCKPVRRRANWGGRRARAAGRK